MRLPLSLWAALTLAVATAGADSTVSTAFKTGGFNGMGAHEGTNTRMLQGTKARDNAQIHFSGRMTRMFAGGDKNGTSIIRVDKGVIWRLDNNKKTYSELPILPPKKMDKTKEVKKEQPSNPAAEEKPTHRIKRSEFDVKKTGAAKTINGFKTEETLATALIEIEEIASGEVTTYSMESHHWLTPWTGDLKRHTEEEANFSRAYLAKMGISVSPETKEAFGGSALMMMLGVGDAKTSELLAKIKEKTKDSNGFPILTTSEWRVKEDPKAIARRDEERAKANTEDSSPEISGDVQGMAGSLLGGFAKKKMRESQAKKEKAHEGEPVFWSNYEVKSISVAALPSADFEIPAGFKKTK